MDFDQFRVLFSLMLGLATGLLGYSVAPKLVGQLALPLERMKVDHDRNRDEAIFDLKRFLLLWVNYAVGATIFLITGGNLAKVTSEGLSSPDTVFVSVAGGLILVAMARTESVFHTFDLLDSLQQLYIAAFAIFVFIVISRFSQIENIQDGLKNLFVKSNGFVALLVGSLVATVWGEAMLFGLQRSRFNSFKWIPYSLLRERIESNEMIEHQWQPDAINEWTINMLENRIGTAGPKSICWFNETNPLIVLNGINAAIEKYYRDHPTAQRLDLTSVVRVISRDQDRENKCDAIREHALANCVRFIKSPTSVRTRFLIINHQCVLVQIPTEHAPLDSTRSSDFSAVVENPVRIADFRTWFEEMWNVAEAPSTMSKSKTAGQV